MKQLILDWNRKTESSRLWEFGVNTCHATLWLRRDLPAQLKHEHDTLGFQYVRFHGVLNDDMDVMRADGTFHFERVIKVYETILKAGMKPFVELSSMPSALQSADSKSVSTVSATLLRGAGKRGKNSLPRLPALCWNISAKRR